MTPDDRNLGSDDLISLYSLLGYNAKLRKENAGKLCDTTHLNKLIQLHPPQSFRIYQLDELTNTD